MIPDKPFWYEIRRALLVIVETIEIMLGVKPTTSELRKEKDLNKNR